MPHFIYIIYSESHDVYYKGETTDPDARLLAHNTGLSEYTFGKGPWKMVYLEECPDRTAALKREKMLKRQNRRYIQWLLTQPINKLS